MIITVTEAKTLLGITALTYDTIIKAYIPIVEAAICQYCKDEFVEVKKNYLDTFSIRMYKYATTLSFVALTNSMNDSAGGLASTDFKVGDSVRIYNSLDNEGFYTIKTIAAGSIVFEDVNTIYDEAAGQNILMCRVRYPIDLKMVAARMINYSIRKNNPGVKSESIDDYSYTNYDDKQFVSGYPATIMNQLNQHRALYKRSIPALSELLIV